MSVEISFFHLQMEVNFFLKMVLPLVHSFNLSSTALGISFNYVVFVANLCIVTFSEYVNMTQFMKKYMIQTLYMDAWDLGTFYIGDQLFLGVSQLGGKSFVIYKWDSQHR